MKIADLQLYKKNNNKITALTAYDSSFAYVFDKCNIDIILVGDSLGNVIKGDKNTLKVSIDEMVYHTKNVAKGCENALIISDMPYKCYETPKMALKNAKLLITAGANMIKLEGGKKHQEVFKFLLKNGINLCGHLGLLPQSIEKTGYKVQGKDENSAQRIFNDSILLEKLGFNLIILECIPSNLSKKITEKLAIPTIGIGAGVNCDGQILVSYDMLGITQNTPKFVKNFAVNKDIINATKEFILQVKNSTFPSSKYSYN